MNSLATWVLTLLTSLEPNTPWKGTYLDTAQAFAEAAQSQPLFAGPDGSRRTAAVLISVAWFEGHFKQDAQGDCDETDPKTGTCKRGSKPHSFCTFQIHESNFATYGVTKEQLLGDIRVCTATALKIMKGSMQVCASMPLLDRLAWYTAGGDSVCRPNVKGRHRMTKAHWLFDHFPLRGDANQ